MSVPGGVQPRSLNSLYEFKPPRARAFIIKKSVSFHAETRRKINAHGVTTNNILCSNGKEKFHLNKRREFVGLMIISLDFRGIQTNSIRVYLFIFFAFSTHEI